MAGFPYRLEEMRTPAMGLIVLRVDETIESELRRALPDHEARLHVTRVDSGDDLTPQTIAAMERNLGSAASLLPRAADFDVVAYACTSGTALIGADRVAQRVLSRVPARAVTNPLTAALARLDHLGLGRIGLVSPYVASVAQPVCAGFAAHGIEVADTLSFGEESEARVARIAPASIAEAARTLAQRSDIEAVFLSCTNLKTFGLLPALEAELGLPVLSSNSVLAWHMRYLSGLDGPDA